MAGSVHLCSNKFQQLWRIGFAFDRNLSVGLIAGLMTATAAQADWRKELGTFRIGMIEVGRSPIFAIDLDKIRAAYASALGMPVEIFQARDFPSLIDAHASSLGSSMPIYTAQAFATASLACQCVEPLAAPVSADGSAGVRDALIVDPALSMSALAASKGIGMPGRNALSTMGVALAAFQSGGVRLTGAETWLRVEEDMNAVMAKFGDGSLDGFFAAVPSRLNLAQTPDGSPDLSAAIAKTGRKAKALWLSELVPFGPHAVRKNLAPEAKAVLSKMLLELGSTNPDLNDLMLPEGATAFTVVNQGAYGLALEATRALAAASAAPKP